MLFGGRRPLAACQFVSACGLSVTLSGGVFEQQQQKTLKDIWGLVRCNGLLNNSDIAVAAEVSYCFPGMSL